MAEANFPWGHARRYNTYSEYFRKHFGKRVQKLTLDAGFTCPNRDGQKGVGGCTYCNNDAFNPSYCQPHKSVTQQIAEGIEFHQKRYRRASEFLAYFQAYSNTYAPVEKLKNLYSEALACPNVIGLVIGTRPDCMPDVLLDYFEELSKKVYLVIEYGIESCYNATLERINRGHTFEESVEAIEKTAARGIMTGAHIIFGLPCETREQMLAQATIISKLPLHSLKLHQLQIMKNTAMAVEYQQFPERFNLFGLEKYISFICDFMERLRPDIVLERLTGEAPPRYLVSAPWSNLRADQVQILIEQELEKRDSRQGRLFSS